MVNHDTKSKWKRLPCSPPALCSVSSGCPQCNGRRVRRRVASLFRTIDILASEVHLNFGCFTFTLPGKASLSAIRNGSLSQQFSYGTKTVKLRVGSGESSRRVSASIRGLPTRLEAFGVDGCIIGMEFTNGGGVSDTWNTHGHAILVSTSKITIPETKKNILENWEYEELGEQNPWSKSVLMPLGFGAQYQYTHIGGVEEALREIGKLTYGVKLQRDQDGQVNMDLYHEMEHFFRKNPRLMRKTGICRIPWEDKLRWAELYPNRPGADFILNYEQDTKHINDLEQLYMADNPFEVWKRVDEYGRIITKKSDKNGINTNKSNSESIARSRSNKSLELHYGFSRSPRFNSKSRGN